MLARFNAVVHKIYEGCTDPSAWPDIVAAVADHLGAEKGLLLTPFTTGRDGFVFPHQIAATFISLWATRYQPEDMWARRLLERDLGQEGRVTLGHELVADEEL